MDKSENKVALITGASTGIGAVYADRLARKGFDLILVARDLARLKAIQDRLSKETGRKIEVVRADLSSSEGLLKVESIIDSNTDISMLVNNAGYSQTIPFIEANRDDCEKMIFLNVIAVTRLSHAAAQSFVKRKEGTIVNIGSGIVFMPDQYSGIYGGSKAYVLNFTRNLAAQVEPLGIRVQVVLPGAVLTEAWTRSGTDMNAVPKEMFMSAEDLVDASLAGLQQKEIVTMPSLLEETDWNMMEEARERLIPQIFNGTVADRYKK